MQDFPRERTKPITIAIDAMGGDNAPKAVVAGAVAAAHARPNIHVVLVGVDTVIRALLATHGTPPANLTLQHASQIVEMDEAPGIAIRQKRDSSIAVASRMVRDGEADAVVSAGNSGAMMAAGMLILKPQPGVDRPAIATLLPSIHGRTILLDAGATTDCKPTNLVQFAHMGNRYATAVLECDRPRVGLLSIGEESTKGDELTKETHKLLLDEPLNFIGNVEPKEVVRGEVDVIVCDGFVGNLVLKTGEAFGELLMTCIKSEIKAHFLYRLAALFLKPAFRRVGKMLDYAEYGGALLLGVNGVVVICHGRSNALAIENAVKVAALAADRHMGEQLISVSHNDLVNTTPH